MTETKEESNPGARSAVVRGLKTLATPDEGGTKKEYEDFLEKIHNHVIISWQWGKDIAQVVKTATDPIIEEPEDLDPTDESKKWKVRLWEQAVDRYGSRIATLAGNKEALYALIIESISPLAKSKLRSKQGFRKAEECSDPVWLLAQLEDIMVRFEEVKPKILAIDDQMQRIMNLKQGEATNEDFIKLIVKELKVYEKHGGDFLWGEKQKEDLARKLQEVRDSVQEQNKSLTDEEEKEQARIIKKELREEVMAMAIMKRADKKRYGNLLIQMKNSYLMGNDLYPTTVADVLRVLDNYEKEWPSHPKQGNNGNSTPPPKRTGVAFTLSANGDIKLTHLRGTNNSFFSNITCNLCRLKGHYKSHCPVADKNGAKIASDDKDEGAEAAVEEVSVRCGILLNNHSESSNIPSSWVLLDSESTDHIFCNDKLVTDIHVVTDGEGLRLYSSGGHLDSDRKGKFGDFSVWFNPQSLANILSLSQVAEKYRVTLDTLVENAFNVHISEGHTLKFHCGPTGLYYLDTSKLNLSKLKQAFSFFNTVSDNMKLYKKRDVRKAQEVISLNRKINNQSGTKLTTIVKNNWIRNVPITVGDISRSEKIFGPQIPPLKGRTRDRQASRVASLPMIQIPRSLFEDLQNVTLCIDFHFVNNVTVFHTISRRINYRTVSFPLSRSKTQILAELEDVYKKYNARGFRVTEIHADKEFEKIESDVMPVRLRICGVDEHVPEIERSIQTQKNENRATCYAMPYKCFPRIMVRELIKQGNEFLNAFGTEDCVAPGLTPRNIIDNLPHIDYHDLKYEFGQYVHLHIAQKQTNTMASRTIGAIVLGPRKIQGQYNYMSLETGEQIDGRVVAVLPPTDDVIHRVEELGRDQKQPYRISRALKYEWQPGQPITHDDSLVTDDDAPSFTDNIIPPPVRQPTGTTDVLRNNPYAILADDTDEDDTDDEDGMVLDQGATAPMDHIHYQDNDDLDLMPDTTHNPRPLDNDDYHSEGTTSDDEIEFEERDEPQHEVEIEERHNTAFEPQEDILEDHPIDTSEAAISNEETISDTNNENHETAERTTERERRSQHLQTYTGPEYGRGKRITKPKKWSFLQTRTEDLNADQRTAYFREAWRDFRISKSTKMLERCITGIVFAQMSAKKGIQKYGREAEIQLLAEFKQILEYKTFHGRKANELTREQKRRAARMINLIEEKINRGHTFENPVLKGRSCYNGKVQRGFYTKEETAAPTLSQDGFYLSSLKDVAEERDIAITDVKGAYLNAKMKGEVIMKIVGREVELFIELDPTLEEFVVIENGQKVLYVQLDKALYGCVQSALLWYELYSNTLKDMGFEINPYDLCVANAMIDGSQCTICWYVDDNKISHKDPKVVDRIIAQLEEKFGQMSKTRGTNHEYLGMSLKFQNRKIEVCMKKHILKAIEDFMEDIVKDAATPATSYLFNIREHVPKLSKEKAENFHSVVASLVFVSKRCRYDIQTAVAFLCTRVSEPDEDDWAKLRRVLQYLRGTIDMKLYIGFDDLTKMKSWVDVSYAVHHDCRSHTGGIISFGWGVLLTKSQKQKLNTKSSTEGEIVGVSDYLPNIIWTRMFLEAQGVVLKENILYQDNQSAIKIEKNGKTSGGQKTKHMDARYFFIKDRLETEQIKVDYCPTEIMLADFFTKPLQGSLFRKFRDVIMGHKHIDTLKEPAESSTSQERVENEEIDSQGEGAVEDTSAETNDNKGGKGKRGGDFDHKQLNSVNLKENAVTDDRNKEKKISFFLDNPN